jgi:hypothetical protein
MNNKSLQKLYIHLARTLSEHKFEEGTEFELRLDLEQCCMIVAYIMATLDVNHCVIEKREPTPKEYADYLASKGFVNKQGKPFSERYIIALKRDGDAGLFDYLKD